jgi:lipoprotein-releasing system permease protein
MYKLLLVGKYLRTRVTAILAMLSVTLCVALVLIVVSVMGGFLETLKQHSRGLLSDLVVGTQTLLGFPHYQEFIDHIEEKYADQIELASPVIYNYGVIRVGDTSFTKVAQVVGIRLDEYRRVNAFEEALFYDKYFPGTTTLAEQSIPFSGHTPQRDIRLPEKYQKAFETYAAKHPEDPNIINHQKKLAEDLWGNWPGPGAYADIFSLDEVEIEPFDPISGEGVKPGFTGRKAPGVIVGVDVILEKDQTTGEFLRDSRMLYRGHEMILTLLPLTHRGSVSAENAQTLRMRYADDAHTKVYDIDKMNVYIDFDLAQGILNMDPQELESGEFTPARASQVLVRLKPGVNEVNMKDCLQTEWASFLEGIPSIDEFERSRLTRSVNVNTWEDQQRPFIAAVEKEKVLVTFLFGIISLVAVVLIFCIFYMLVEKKTRDIGIIKSVGATSQGVMEIFLIVGAAVGVVGGLAGTGIGMIVVRNINEIQDFLEKLHPELRIWSPDVYSFDRIPTNVDWGEVGGIFAVAVISSMLGAMIPAIIAARVWPVDALRYE